jgi:hypothetical protein
MIQRAGMKPESLGLIAPGFVDCPLQKILAEALTDELRHQAKLDQFDFVVVAPVQLGKARRRAFDMQDVDLVERIVDEGGKLGIRKAGSKKPIVVFAHTVVKKAVKRQGWIFGVKDTEPAPGRRHGSLDVGEHFQVVNGHIHERHKSSTCVGPRNCSLGPLLRLNHGEYGEHGEYKR